MKKFVLVYFALFIGSTVNAQDNSKNIPFPANVQRVLFLGNSITYQGDYVSYVEACIRVMYPHRHFEFINVGLPSETVSGLSEEGHADGAFPRPDLHERLARVLKLTKPDLVFANYGMNDGIYKPLADDRFQKYKAGIVWLHEEVAKANAKIIFLTPPVYDEKKGSVQGYNAVLDIYSRWLLRLADSLHWPVADLHFPMATYLQDHRATDPGFALASDGVHPGELGHWIMAKQILLYLDRNAPVQSAGDIHQALLPYRNGEEILKLVNQRQQMMKDAWLTATRHKRPGMNQGMPLNEAEAKAASIESELRKLLK